MKLETPDPIDCADGFGRLQALSIRCHALREIFPRSALATFGVRWLKCLYFHSRIRTAFPLPKRLSPLKALRV